MWIRFGMQPSYKCSSRWPLASAISSCIRRSTNSIIMCIVMQRLSPQSIRSHRCWPVARYLAFWAIWHTKWAPMTFIRWWRVVPAWHSFHIRMQLLVSSFCRKHFPFYSSSCCSYWALAVTSQCARVSLRPSEINSPNWSRGKQSYPSQSLATALDWHTQHRYASWTRSNFVHSFHFILFFVYNSQGGQWALTLIDYFGTSFIVFFLSIIEIVAVCWIYGMFDRLPVTYNWLICWRRSWFFTVFLFVHRTSAGVDRLCRDIEFMMNRKTGVYWRLCWGLITPLLLIFILLYTFVDFHPLTYNDKPFPAWAYGKPIEIEIEIQWQYQIFFSIRSVIGVSISILGIIQVPIFALRTVRRQRNGHTCGEKFAESFLPKADWGPMNPAKFEEYLKFVNSYESQRELLPRGNVFQRIKRNMFG